MIKSRKFGRKFIKIGKHSSGWFDRPLPSRGARARAYGSQPLVIGRHRCPEFMRQAGAIGIGKLLQGFHPDQYITPTDLGAGEHFARPLPGCSLLDPHPLSRGEVHRYRVHSWSR